MNDKTEIFRNIQGYEGIYQVSNLGRVKSLKNNKDFFLKNSLDSMGYYHVTLYKNNNRKTLKVHQLVAIAFLNHTPNGHKLVVNHKDFDKTNNKVNNLEIVTQRENANQKHIKSSSKYTGVSWRKTNKKWVSNIVINGKIKNLGLFTNEIDASNAYKNALAELTYKEIISYN